MSKYLTPFSGKVAIGICDRCRMKKYYADLRPDGNSPGLRVCSECWDVKDPWRLAPIQPENISLPYARPDEDIST